MTISFHPFAERELNEAAAYYDRETEGLGAAFLSEIERTSASLTEFPDSGISLTTSIRRRLLRRFPYALLYSVEVESIRILAVMNLKRRPGYWLGR
jgi:plasmid stabilization system protein ParE